MTLRLLNKRCIHKQYTFLSLVSSSKFHYKHRYISNESNFTKLIPFHVSNHNQKRRMQTHIELDANINRKSINFHLHNICYCTYDSIVSPKRGYERVHTLCTTTKGHMQHFWNGTKLMGTDIHNAFKLLIKLSNGGQLTYSERCELRIVAMDAFKFVPMLIIVLIPFLEASLPFLLYFFPNMLPSRFQSENMKLEKRKKVLSARIGLTAFFEDHMNETILKKIKNGEALFDEEITSLFDDAKALNHAPYPVLTNMCRCMDLNTYGTSAMLRMRLCHAIRDIRREDEGIKQQCSDNIPLCLLEELTRERGMRNDFSLLLFSQIFAEEKHDVCIE